MKFSDEQIRDILKLKDHIMDEIEKHKEEIDLLEKDRKSTRLNSSHMSESRMPSSA